jgi:hypothetical protein
MNWTEQNILKVINVVMTQQNTEYNEVNKQLGEFFGEKPSTIVCSRVTIQRVLQGFGPESLTGGVRGHSFGKQFIPIVNEWFNETYKGGLSRNALSHKFD